MDALIEFEYNDSLVECIVEYIEYVERGDTPYDTSALVKEVVNVYLPEEYSCIDKKTFGEIKMIACEEFHNQY
jgi:hypothetical protein